MKKTCLFSLAHQKCSTNYSDSIRLGERSCRGADDVTRGSKWKKCVFNVKRCTSENAYSCNKDSSSDKLDTCVVKRHSRSPSSSRWSDRLAVLFTSWAEMPAIHLHVVGILDHRSVSDHVRSTVSGFVSEHV